ncbi:Gamma-glutamylcyclotransferase [Paragonimus heterotremus]|uniref:glutathione-specific gamma-glutamylcyclotransferase n=1 Tax=Paragonimus heterotremus TaxID=100268 RepID=A0A8J4TII5_9TREM|nr:Gamma-glutamylcyclotransferase [Paragonimus heterotremus]
MCAAQMQSAVDQTGGRERFKLYRMPPGSFSRKRDSFVIFGYGSLIWRPNFSYAKRSVGYIKGYKRRFYQGSIVHRGTPTRPGRVATLLPSTHEESRVWGCAYEINGEGNVEAALEHLHDREVVNGGYRLVQVEFYPAAADAATPQKAWVYVHFGQDSSHPQESQLVSENTPLLQSNSYLGKATLSVQAAQIASAQGVCGPNSEYVLHIANFMRKELPSYEALKDDPYLFQLEQLIKQYLLHNWQVDYQADELVPPRHPRKSVSETKRVLEAIGQNEHNKPQQLSATH